MAGIYRPERGKISVAGRLAPFIELGVGFNPDQTALDNVVINGVMMGLTRREARRRFDEIIEFAELGDFLDMKLKNYSSGMQVRLGFAVMVQASADVLLIDEVLAVGDASFQQKCLDVFYRLRDEGRTIVLVTHDMAAVEQFCHRAMFLQDGNIEMIGDPVDVGRAYLAANFADDTQLAEPETIATDHALVNVHVVDVDGMPTTSQPSGEPLRARVDIVARLDVDHPVLSLELRDAEHSVVTGARIDLHERGPLRAGQSVMCVVEIDTTLADGHYDLGARLTQGSAEVEVLVDARTAAGVIVHSARPEIVGSVHLPTRIRVEHIQQEVSA
jgi:ABC-type polysaccharide/polyol phosphate transport system ATPase subunit